MNNVNPNDVMVYVKGYYIRLRDISGVIENQAGENTCNIWMKDVHMMPGTPVITLYGKRTVAAFLNVLRTHFYVVDIEEEWNE